MFVIAWILTAFSPVDLHPSPLKQWSKKFVWQKFFGFQIQCNNGLWNFSLFNLHSELLSLQAEADRPTTHFEWIFDSFNNSCESYLPCISNRKVPFLWRATEKTVLPRISGSITRISAFQLGFQVLYQQYQQLVCLL